MSLLKVINKFNSNLIFNIVADATISTTIGYYIEFRNGSEFLNGLNLKT